MKNLTIISICTATILLGVISCKTVDKNIKAEYIITPTSTVYYPNKILDSLSNFFIDSAKCKNCLNELYIDKVYDDEIYFTFIAMLSDKEYLTNHKPLFIFSLKDKIIYVYTGAESYINGNQGNNQLNISEGTNGIHYLRLQFKIEADTVKMINIPSSPFGPQIRPAPEEDNNIPKFDP